MATARIHAPAGGVNTDAGPDYLQNTQAAELLNLLPGQPGKVVLRGPIVVDNAISDVGTAPVAFWAHGDSVLVTGDTGITRLVKLDFPTSNNDRTATLVEVPYSSRHARYGAYVYGAIVDAATPQLGRWDGAATAIVPQANAPFQFVDLQVHAQRLFVLGGTAPGTTTPVINEHRVLWWTDPSNTADLSLLASWQDDVSGLTNKLLLDTDDTPVGLAGCGKFMAILGTRSINILTGSGTSSFAIRNLSKNWGCSDVETIVEVDDGFYFLSDRGFSFCDGSTVQLVSDGAVSGALEASSGVFSAAAWNHGYVAVALKTGGCWLYHIQSKAWTTLSLGADVPSSVHRSNTYPLMVQNSFLYTTDNATGPFGGEDDMAGTDTTIPFIWRSRFIPLASPTAMAVVSRILLDFKMSYSGPVGGPPGLRLQVYDTVGNELVDTTTDAAVVDWRTRFQVDCNGEADAIQIVVSNPPDVGGVATSAELELYDAWVEFAPAQVRKSL